MKRYIDFFHIKAVLIFLIIVFPIIFIFTVVMLGGFLGDYSGAFEYMPITFKNAPEGTAYVDLLIKLDPSDENYTEFAEWEQPPQRVTGYTDRKYKVYNGKGEVSGERVRTVPVYEPVNISPNSEIANLNDNGYVSFSVHFKTCKGFSYSEREHSESLLEKSDILDVKKRYGKFKAAYVDEQGRVLQITHKALTRYRHKAYCLAANGNSLTLTVFGYSPLQTAILFVSFFGEPTAILVLIVCIILNRVQNKYPKNPPASDNKKE